MAYKHILIAVDLSRRVKYWLKKPFLWPALITRKSP